METAHNYWLYKLKSKRGGEAKKKKEEEEVKKNAIGTKFSWVSTAKAQPANQNQTPY